MSEVVYLIHITIPGVPFVYYGDEIGMKHRDLPSKEGGYQRTGDRTPMQWDNSKNRGFSDFDGELYLPQGDEKTNVFDSINDPSSILNSIKNLIEIRKQHQEFLEDNFKLINREDKVLSYSRGRIKVVINLSDREIKLNDVNQVIYLSNEKALNDNSLSKGTGIIYD